jgi:hypothetical protein
MGLRAVAGDGGSVVAEVDVWLEAGDALAGDAGALEAADEFFGFAGEHGAGDDFNSAWRWCRHWEMVTGLVVDFLVLIFLGGGVAFLQGFSKKRMKKRWLLGGNLRSFGGHNAVLMRTDLGIEKKA